MKHSNKVYSVSRLPMGVDEYARQNAFRVLSAASQPESQPASSARLARLVRVKKSVRLTPNMQRVTVTGEELTGFPEGYEGAHVKLMLPGPQQSEREFVDQTSQGRRHPITRTYTVRHHRPDLNEIDIDFALHPFGRACNWAVQAQPGDFIAIAGPSPAKMTNFSADWFLLTADMAAIPAAAAILDKMPRHAVGHAVFEIASPDDRQPVDAPPGMELHWLIAPSVCGPSDKQLQKVKSLPWGQGDPGVFVAGEASAMKAVRQFLTEDKGLDRKAIYASAYWKIGMREDQHRKLKLREAAAVKG